MTLKHVDSALGLKMLGGNEALYKKFLNDFIATNKPEIGQFEVLWETDKNTLKRKVHTIKSQAGTIGATNLQTLAEELEESLCVEKLRPFCQEFLLLVEELNEQFELNIKSTSASDKIFDEIKEYTPIEKVDKLFSQLEDAFSSSKPKVINQVIGQIERCHLSTKDQALLIELQQLHKQYQYKNAYQIVQVRKSSYY